MNSDWSFTHLVRATSLSGDRVGGLLAALEQLRIEPQRHASDGDIVCISGGGDQVRRFYSAEAAVRWLGEYDGLIPLITADGLELSISLQRVGEVLPVAMAGLPDLPVYDSVILDVPASFRWTEGGSGPGLSRVLTAVATALGAVFVYAMDEESLEMTIARLCVHRRVSADALPPFAAWLTAVPQASPLAGRLRTRAALLARPVDRLGSYVGLRLTNELPSRSAAVIEEASARVRAGEHDPGCH